MDFAYWQNKNRPTMERVYLNSIDGFNDQRKIWCERIGRSNTWKLKASDPLLETEEKTIKQLTIQHMEERGVDKKDTVLFDALVESAKLHTSRAPKTSKVYPSSAVQEDKANHIPDLSTIKVPDSVHIKIDHREPQELLDYLSDLPNVNVERCALDLGDIVINDQIIIERKCCDYEAGGTDFENSIVDDSKRLFNQSERLKFEEDKIAIILLEGDVYGKSKRMLVQAIDGSISFLCSIQKLSVITSYNIKHTAYLILKLATHEKSGLGYELGLRSKKPKALLDQKRFVIEGLPGVSSAIANRLIERFGSLKAIFNATEKELEDIVGLGPKKIEKLLKVLQ